MPRIIRFLAAGAWTAPFIVLQDINFLKNAKRSAAAKRATVGPVWHGGDKDEDALLASAYRRSLEVAESAGAKTISFPSISTGAYSFPVERAAIIAIATIQEYINQRGAFDEIRIVCFDDRTLKAYQKASLAEEEK
jgi:O-acetyl-ADP-ribose deacetylase (regulator of RNase III)